MPQIKRYSNRKLYDTQAGQYVTLDDIAGFIRSGEDVRVVDHASGRDLTAVTLMQVLFQEEKKIGELLPEVGDNPLDSYQGRDHGQFTRPHPGCF